MGELGARDRGPVDTVRVAVGMKRSRMRGGSFFADLSTLGVNTHVMKTYNMIRCAVHAYVVSRYA